jgi:hypothetical protein
MIARKSAMEKAHAMVEKKVNEIISYPFLNLH